MTHLEDELRTTLHRHASLAGPVTAPPPALERRARMRRTRSVLATGLVAAAVVVAGIGVGRILAPGPDPDRPAPAPAPVYPPVTPVPIEPLTNGDLVLMVDEGLARRHVDGTLEQWVTKAELTDACGRRGCSVGGFALSPDGTKLAVLMGVFRRTSPSELGVYVVDGADGMTRKLFDCASDDCTRWFGSALSWSPDGRALATTGAGGILTASVDARTPPSQLCDQCRGSSPDWSPDGRWLAYAGAEGAYRVPTTGGRPELVVRAPGVSSVTWSPEGTRLAVSAVDGLRVVDLSQHPYRTTLVAEQGRAEGPAAPAWSPDGRRVAWFGTPGRRPRFVAELWTAEADGSGPLRILRTGCCVSDWTPPVWSPDGRQIALGLGLDWTEPPDLLLLDSSDGSRISTLPGVGWGPLSWPPAP